MASGRPRLAWLVLALFIALVLSALGMTGCMTATPEPTPSPTRAARATFTPTPTPAAPPPSATATRSPTPAATSTPVTIPSPTADARLNPLTGLVVADPSLLQKRPIHVCIDNDTGSRPHLGLDKADIVYEYIMELFYNTRFTAVYWGQEADRIGPLRSVRLVNLELAPQYDALMACQGGSDGTLWNIVKDGRAAYYEFFEYNYAFMDMNWATGYYTIYGKNPYAGTSLVQTSTALLRKWLHDNGKEKSVKVTSFTFSPQGAPALAAMAATTVSIPYPSGCCSVEWAYDAAAGRYLRTMDGKAHIDGASNQRLSAANVIVVYATHDLSNIVEAELADGTVGYGYRIRLVGEGKASIFRDGVAILAFWRRNKLTDMMQMVDAAGKPILLKPGNSWIEIVPDDKFTVTFK